MGIVVRQSVKSAIVTMVGALLGVAVTLLSMRYLDKTAYGLTQILLRNSILFSYLTGLGYTGALIILGQKYHAGHPARGAFLKHSLILPLIATLLICLLLIVFRQPLLHIYTQEKDYAVMNRYFILFPVFIAINFIFTWLEAYLQSINKNTIQSLMREFLLRLINILLIVLFFLNVIDLSIYLWAYVFTYILPILIMLFVARKDKGFQFAATSRKLNKQEQREIIIFSLYHMLMLVSANVILQMDSLLLTPLAKDGIDAVAVYTVASYAALLLRSPTRVMGIAIMPTLTRTYNQDDLPLLRKLFVRSSVNMQSISVVLAALLVVNINNLTRFFAMIKPGYEMATPLMLILIIGVLADVFFGPNSEMISVTKYFRFNFWISVLLIVIVFLLNTFLIKRIGIAGAAWSTASGLIIFNLLKAGLLWNRLQLQPFSYGTFKGLFIGAITIAVVYFIPYTGNLLADFFIRSTAAIIILALSFYKLNVSEDVTGLVHNIIHKRKLF